MQRLTLGIDPGLIRDILTSDKWVGSGPDLGELIQKRMLKMYDLPLREAIDCVYASVYTTIKAMKFSQLPQVCGGPIEVAVISTDRPFRWVCHKTLKQAIDTHRT